MRFIAMSGSWLNLFDLNFGIIQSQAIRHGTFVSVKDLIAEITRFMNGWNQRCEPFT